MDPQGEIEAFVESSMTAGGHTIGVKMLMCAHRHTAKPVNSYWVNGQSDSLLFSLVWSFIMQQQMGSFEFMQFFSCHLGLVLISIYHSQFWNSESSLYNSSGVKHIPLRRERDVFSSFLRPFFKVASFLTCFVLSFSLSLCLSVFFLSFNFNVLYFNYKNCTFVLQKHLHTIRNCAI